MIQDEGLIHEFVVVVHGFKIDYPSSIYPLRDPWKRLCATFRTVSVVPLVPLLF
jgi:hypothetical protein